jgi:hypothetical protein
VVENVNTSNTIEVSGFLVDEESNLSGVTVNGLNATFVASDVTGGHTFVRDIIVSGAGTQFVTVQASDALGSVASIQQSFILEQNESPTSFTNTPASNPFVVVGDASQAGDFTVSGTFVDANANITGVTLNGTPAFFQLDNTVGGSYSYNGSATVSPGIGFRSVFVEATDELSATGLHSFSVEVVENTPPSNLSFTPTHNATLFSEDIGAGLNVLVSGTFDDAEQNLAGVVVNGINASFSSVDLSGGHSFSSNIDLSPGTGQRDITVVLTDDFGSTLSQTHTLNIAPPYVDFTPADFDGDGQVSFVDFFAFADNFGKDNFDPATDIDDNGKVDLDDFFLFADLFGLGGAGKGWAAPVALEEKANLWLETSGGTRDDGNIAVVRVLTDGAEALMGFGLVLQYDDASLRFIDARPGAGHLLQGQEGQASLFRVLSQTSGRLVLGNALVSGQALSGGGMLAELRFHRQGEATDAFFDLTEAFFYRDGEVTQVVSLASSRLTPKTYALGANFPNPFNPSTSIEYALPQTGSARLTVYDVLGRKVRTLFSEVSHPAGIFTAAWDGRDTNGRAVSNGIYFYRLEAGQFSRTRKMALVK